MCFESEANQQPKQMTQDAFYFSTVYKISIIFLFLYLVFIPKPVYTWINSQEDQYDVGEILMKTF